MQQQQMQQQYLAQHQAPQQYNNQYDDSNSGIMSWDAYNTLSDMSLQNHASMLNSIEAIGGSGDYWYTR